MPSLEEDSEAMLAPLDARAKGSAAMISLSDAELTAVLDACKPLRPGDRDPFLRALAQELGREPQLGPVSFTASREICSGSFSIRQFRRRASTIERTRQIVPSEK